MGLLLAVLVTAARIDDGRAAEKVVGRAAAPDFPRLQLILGDNKYHSHEFRASFFANGRAIRLQIALRPEGAKGFVVINSAAQRVNSCYATEFLYSIRGQLMSAARQCPTPNYP